MRNVRLTRLGGPNFTQIPINTPVAPVDDNLRDGMHQMAVPPGRAPYLPNSLDRGEPALADGEHGGYVHRPRSVHGPKLRASSTGLCPIGFDDHFTQAALFYRSVTEIEQRHIASAFVFELGRCFDPAVRERMVANLGRIDRSLCQTVASGLGLPIPDVEPVGALRPSPALSQIVTRPGPIDGRVVGVLVGPQTDLSVLRPLREALASRKAVLRVIARAGGRLGSGTDAVEVDRIIAATRSIEYDAVLVGGNAGMSSGPPLSVLLQECLRHLKPLGSWGDGDQVLRSARIDLEAPGVLAATAPDEELAESLIALLGRHRVWDRQRWLDEHA